MTSWKMIDRNKLPDPTYFELIDLLGLEKAEEFLNKVHYDMESIQYKIIFETYKRKYGKRFWYYFFGTLILAFIIYQILNAKAII
jgi:hypothetical protein